MTEKTKKVKFTISITVQAHDLLRDHWRDGDMSWIINRLILKEYMQVPKQEEVKTT